MLNIDFFNQIILFVVSLVANLFSAMAGGGAGLLQLPAIIFLGLSFTTALATHKVASVALGVGATVRHLKDSHLERRFAFFILLTGLPGVTLGALVILSVPDRAAELALGVMTVGLAVYSFLQPQLGLVFEPKHRDSSGYFLGGIVMFLIGVLNGSLTSGTGLFVTIWLVKWFGLDYKRAVAYTLILVGLFWNATGAFTLGILGTIQWDWLPALLLGSFIGGYLGAHISISRSNHLIKRVFELMTLLVGLKLIFS